MKYLAFADTEIPLPHGQHMLRPSLAGKILQALDLQGTERVLEVGTGTGFLTACLAVNAASVRSVELYPDLADTARANLRAAGIRNAEVITADAASDEVASPAARAAGSPLRRTLRSGRLTCAMPLPDERFRTLLTHGGRMFVIVGSPPSRRRACCGGWATTVGAHGAVRNLHRSAAQRAPRAGFEF